MTPGQIAHVVNGLAGILAADVELILASDEGWHVEVFGGVKVSWSEMNGKPFNTHEDPAAALRCAIDWFLRDDRSCTYGQGAALAALRAEVTPC